jgi:phytol kinase
VPATRSLEGSAAVLLATAVAAAAALIAGGMPALSALPIAAAAGLATAAVEAVSHHGLDNLTIQVAATAVAALLAG